MRSDPLLGAEEAEKSNPPENSSAEEAASAPGRCLAFGICFCFARPFPLAGRALRFFDFFMGKSLIILSYIP